MRVATAQVVERQGIAVAQELAHFELKWLFREQATSDVGIDCHLEVVHGGDATGRLLAVQVKSGASYFRRKHVNGWWFPVDDEHSAYWLNHSLPVIVVLVNERERRAYWQVVRSDTLERSRSGFRMLVPNDQPFDQSSRERLSALAYRVAPTGETPAEQLAACQQRLPPDVGERVRRLWADGAEVAAGAALQLGRGLAAAASEPARAVTRLLRKGLPPGIDHVAGWQLVASYANEHRLPALSAAAFERAAKAATNAANAEAGRLFSLAALLSLSVDREMAGRCLAQARRVGGADLLVAAVEAFSSAPAGALDRAPLPSEMFEEARRAEADPVIARLVADHLARARDLDAALVIYEALLRRLPSSASVQLALAEALVVQAASRSATPAADGLRRALQLAELARADLRRWSGPSEEAAELIVRASIVSHDHRRALRAVLLPPRGEATERESVSDLPRARAAQIAYLLGNLELGDELASGLEDPGHVAALSATKLDLLIETGRYAGEEALRDQKSSWAQVAELADDSIWRLMAIQRLATMGEWPIALADDYRSTGALDEVTYALLRAEALAAKGLVREAKVALRRHAPHSLAAANQLADVYRKHGDAESALEVLADAIERSSDLGLRLHALDVAAELGRDDVESRIRLILGRHDLRPAVRVGLMERLLHILTEDSRWGEIADVAGALVSVFDDSSSELAPIDTTSDRNRACWAVVGAYFNRRDLNAASASFRRLRPTVTNGNEAGLWAQLNDLDGWSDDDLALAAEYAARFADDERSRSLLLSAIQSSGRPDAKVADAGELDTGVRDRADSPAADTATPSHAEIGLAGVGVQAVSRVELVARFQADRARNELLNAALFGGEVPGGSVAAAMGVPYTMVVVAPPTGVFIAAGPDDAEFDRETSVARSALDRDVVRVRLP